MNHMIDVAGWTLLHFVWQGAALAMVTAAALRCCRRSTPDARYAIACVGFVSMLGAPVVTAGVLWSPTVDFTFGVGGSPAVVTQETVPVGVSNWVDITFSMLTVRAGVDAVLPLVVVTWLCGVTLLLVRMAGGLWRVRQLQMLSLATTASRWQGASARLASRLGVRVPVHVVDTTRVETPTAVGWLRPAILLPIAALANLTPSQVEAILAHELVHIRRHDYVVNVLQTLAETLLFYHPAVWWVSSRIRVEREHCCDDATVELCGDAVNYATALTELEAFRSGDTGLAVAATSGSLRHRVHRILGTPPERDPRSLSWEVTFVLTLVLVGGAAAIGLPSRGLMSRGEAAEVTQGIQPTASPDGQEWEVRATEHFDILYYPSLTDDLPRIEALAQRAYDRVSAEMAYDLGFRVPLMLYKTRDDFEQQTVAPGAMLTGVRSFTEPQRNTIVLLVDEMREELPTRITHELTHVFMFVMIPRSPIRSTVPLWLDEGLADYITGVWPPNDVELLRWVVASDRVPSMNEYGDYGQFENPRTTYALGHAVFDFVEEQWGKEAIRQYLVGFGPSSFGTSGSVYQQAFGVTPDEFDESFERYLRTRFTPQSLPPVGSPALARSIEFSFPTQDGQPRGNVGSYVAQLEIPQRVSRPSQDVWVPYEAAEAVVRPDAERLWNTGIFESLWVDVRDEPYPNGVMGKRIVFSLVEREGEPVVPTGPPILPAGFEDPAADHERLYP